jgi:uncharacterized protein (UPF0335 family)
MSETGPIAADVLRQFIERVERLESDKRDVAEMIKDVYAEAKAAGFDPKVMREVIRLRKLDQDERAEREALLETYFHALGMLADTPLGSAAMRRVA